MIDRPPKRFYEFDEFRVDIDERRLMRLGEPVQLTPKVFDILLTLVENCGHTVEKDRLMESVWADSFVEEGSLNRNVSTLRKVLGEDGHEPRFIKTVPKRGYRFDGNVHEIVEEDEAVVVELRTKYSIAVSEQLDTQSGRITSRLISSRLLIGAASACVVLVLAVVWAVRAPTSDANSFAAEKSNRAVAPQALGLYQRGRTLWQNRSVEGLHQATLDLEQAIRIDPQFALAHAALADAYAFDVSLWKKAEATANEAIRLDPQLGQPHATIGFIRTFWEWRFMDAEPHFRQAIALSPEYATGHQWYAYNLMIRNSVGTSLAEIKRARELEPDSLAINADMCQLLYFAMKYDQALDQCKKTQGIDPSFRPTYEHLYAIYSAKEMYPEAVEAYFKNEELNMTSSTPPARLDAFRKAYATGGIRGFWREHVKMYSAYDRPHAYPLAQYHVRLGNTDEALFWFKRAAGERNFEFIFFTSDPLAAHLLGDPRGKELVNYLSN